MKAAPRIIIQLRPSSWQKRLGSCCAVLFGVAIALVLHDLGWLQPWYLSAAIAVTAAMAFIWIARRQNAKLDSERLRVILAQAKQLWIGGEGIAPALDAPLPELCKLQRYLGLIWLGNTSGAHALIWPDSISADEHRQLRIWLGIHAHRKSK